MKRVKRKHGSRDGVFDPESRWLFFDSWNQEPVTLILWLRIFFTQIDYFVSFTYVKCWIGCRFNASQLQVASISCIRWKNWYVVVSFWVHFKIMIWFMGTDWPLGKKKIRDCFFSQHQPKVISLHTKIRHRPQQKSIIPHITLVAFVASVALFITDWYSVNMYIYFSCIWIENATLMPQ